MPIFEKCCFCVSLRLGGLILGILSLMGAVVQLTFLSLTLNAAVGKNGHKFANYLNHSLENNSPDAAIDAEQLVVTVQYVSIVLIVLSCMTVLCAILLIYGSYSRRRYFMIPYLVSEAVTMLIFLGITCSYFAQKSLIAGFTTMAGIGVEFYLWFCVYSLCQQIREDNHRKETTNHPDLDSVAVGYKLSH